MKKILVSTLAVAALFSGSAAKADPSAVAAGVGGFVLGTIVQQDRYQPVYPYSPGGYYSTNAGRWFRWDRSFPRFRCSTPRDAVQCSYEFGVWERERQAFQRAKVQAYECGRWGRCEQEEE